MDIQLENRIIIILFPGNNEFYTFLIKINYKIINKNYFYLN